MIGGEEYVLFKRAGKPSLSTVDVKRKGLEKNNWRIV